MTRKKSAASGARIVTGITSGAALVTMVAGFQLSAQAEGVVGNPPEVLPISPSAAPEGVTPVAVPPSAVPAPVLPMPANEEVPADDSGTDTAPVVEPAPAPTATAVAPQPAPATPPPAEPAPVPTPTATSRAS